MNFTQAEHCAIYAHYEIDVKQHPEERTIRLDTVPARSGSASCVTPPTTVGEVVNRTGLVTKEKALPELYPKDSFNAAPYIRTATIFFDILIIT